MSPLEGHTGVLLGPHPLWLEAVSQVLTNAGVDVTGKATTIDQALALVDRLQPELLVVEIETPPGKTDGITCLVRARERAPSMKCIVLSASDDRQHVEAAFSAGAVAYVLKTAQPSDLAVAVRQAFAPSVYLADRPREKALEAKIPLQVESTADLTRREMEILRLVAEGHSNAQLARMLWVTEQTVKFHLSNIYRKLDVSNRTEASRWAQMHGLLPTAIPAASAA
jgi:DNA-binding NarL/FixJ family response regulator